MAMFWEFFTFELKFRFKSLSTYIYFAVWFAFSFLDIASEGFGPIGNSNGKVLLNGPYANIYNDIGIAFFGVIVIAAIFGTSILRDFQRDTIQILFTKPISKLAYLGGRWAGSFATTVCLFRPALRRVFRHPRPLGRPRPHRPQPPLLVSAAVLLHRGLPDLLPRFSLLPGRRPIAQDLHRLPAGRGHLHAVPHRHHDFQRHAFSRALLVRHPRPGWLPVQRRHHPLLDRRRTQHASVLLVNAIVAAIRRRGLPVQPPALGLRRPVLAPRALEVIPHVGRSADRPLQRQTRRPGPPAGAHLPSPGGSRPTAQPGCGQAPRRSPGLRRADNLGAAHLAHPPAHLQHRA